MNRFYFKKLLIFSYLTNPLTDSSYLQISRVFGSIWNPSVRIKIPHHFQPALDIHESEKAAIFGESSIQEE